MSAAKLVVALSMLALLLISGCASQWRPRPGSSPYEFARDKYRCTQESRTGFSAGGTGKAGAGAIIGAAIGAQMNAQYLGDLCMEASGHTKVQPETYAATPAGMPTVGVAQSINPPPMPQQPPQAYYPAPTAAMNGAPRMDYPASQSLYPTGFIPQPAQPVIRQTGAAVAATSIRGESKYTLAAEKLTKANGCVQPEAAMTTKGPGTEVFSVTCASGDVIVVRCDYNDCRMLTGITP